MINALIGKRRLWEFLLGISHHNYPSSMKQRANVGILPVPKYGYSIIQAGAGEIITAWVLVSPDCNRQPEGFTATRTNLHKPSYSEPSRVSPRAITYCWVLGTPEGTLIWESQGGLTPSSCSAEQWQKLLDCSLWSSYDDENRNWSTSNWKLSQSF